MDEDYMHAEWVFESRVTQPNGITVICTVRVPRSAAWADVREANEIAQMCTGRATSEVVTAKTRSEEKAPF